MEGEKGDCKEEIGELLVALVDELIYNHYFVIDILGKIPFYWWMKKWVDINIDGNDN